MSFISDEVSIQSSNPIEMYLFNYKDDEYAYTSYSRNISTEVEGSWHTFNSEYIERSESLVLDDSSSRAESCIISVPRTNSVALLYQGAPPEQGSIRVRVYRKHGVDSGTEIVKLVDGIISQVVFEDSKAEMTVTIENMLSRYIPRGKLSYYCQNCLYDSRCKVSSDMYGIKCYVDISMDYTHIMSTNLNERPSGYFTGGFIKMGRAYRAVKLHSGNSIWLKYPISLADREGSFMVYPGCDNTFRECATKFHNTDNFSGVPYIEPYNAFTHPVITGAYWIDGNIVYRDTHGKLYS